MGRAVHAPTRKVADWWSATGCRRMATRKLTDGGPKAAAAGAGPVYLPASSVLCSSMSNVLPPPADNSFDLGAAAAAGLGLDFSRRDHRGAGRDTPALLLGVLGAAIALGALARNVGRLSSLLDHAALVLELESLLGRKVDIASDGWVKPSIREPVYRDAVPL